MRRPRLDVQMAKHVKLEEAASLVNEFYNILVQWYKVATNFIQGVQHKYLAPVTFRIGLVSVAHIPSEEMTNESMTARKRLSTTFSTFSIISVNKENKNLHVVFSNSRQLYLVCLEENIQYVSICPVSRRSRDIEKDYGDPD